MIVLDTHALIWWVSGQELSRAAKEAMAAQHGEGQLLVSCITAWELALLVKRGKLDLAMAVPVWLAFAERAHGVKFVPVSNEIAVASIDLPDPFHSDPADRIIVATARTVWAPLVTADEKIRSYPHVRTIW